MAPKDKMYHLLSETETFTPEARSNTFQLPAPLHISEPISVGITITDDIAHWDSVDRLHDVLLRIRLSDVTEMAHVVFKLNGMELPESLLRKINEVYRMTAARYGARSSYWFIFKLDREHWPVPGKNILEVTLLETDPDLIAEAPRVRDVELEIKYLLGKNFHRGFVDPSLGPYEIIS